MPPEIFSSALNAGPEFEQAYRGSGERVRPGWDAEESRCGIFRGEHWT
jgi:hypothetical protein